MDRSKDVESNTTREEVGEHSLSEAMMQQSEAAIAKGELQFNVVICTVQAVERRFR